MKADTSYGKGVATALGIPMSEVEREAVNKLVSTGRATRRR